MIWSTKVSVFTCTWTHTQRPKYVQMYHISLCSLSRLHNTHTRTHTIDQRPCPGNLFQPICATVRVVPIVSCVCNVSETVIGKSFETLKSLSLQKPRFLLSPASLTHCQIWLHHRSISCSFHLYPSTSHIHALYFSLSPSSFCQFLSFKDYTAVGVCALKAASQLVLLTHLVQWSSSRQRHKLSHKANTVAGFFLDLMLGWVCEQQHIAKHCCVVSYMCMLLTTWWGYSTGLWFC